MTTTTWADNPKLGNAAHYFKLMRLHAPTGIFLLMWPGLWSIFMASSTTLPSVGIILVFVIGALLMRSSGCIINDLVDKNIDAKVERTKHRPLASGDITVVQAFILLALLLLLSLLLLLTLNNIAIIMGCAILLPVIAYPFMKRITYWPQLFLAFTINWGALMGWFAVSPEISIQPFVIYLACCFWTLGYDTIYAHQDKADDVKAGVKSTALKFGVHTKRYVYGFYGIANILLWLAGVLSGLGILFHVCLIISLVQLIWQVMMVDLNDPKDCMAKFASNTYYGAIVFIGIVLGSLV